jgi:hypothetical protein
MTQPKTVIVTGSRYWTNVGAIELALEAEQPTLVVHGGARGADAIAHAWARRKGVAVQEYPADWQRQGKRAGPIRNVQMVSAHHTAVVLAFPLGGPGTKHCMNVARIAGLVVKVVLP